MQIEGFGLRLAHAIRTSLSAQIMATSALVGVAAPGEAAQIGVVQGTTTPVPSPSPAPPANETTPPAEGSSRRDSLTGQSGEQKQGSETQGFSSGGPECG